MTTPTLQSPSRSDFAPRYDHQICGGQKGGFRAGGLSICAALGLAGTAHAAIIAFDDFTTYTPGPIAGQSGGTGFTGTWSVSGLGGAALATGNSLELTPGLMGGTRANHTLAPNSAFPTDGSAAYARIEFSMRSGGGTAHLIQSGLSLGGGTFWVTGVDNQQFWANGASGTGTVAFDTSYILISRVIRNDAGNDSLVAWLNPTSEADAPILSATNSYNQSASALNTFELIANAPGANPDTLIIKNVVIGTTFSDVASVPEPSTGILLVGGLLGLAAGRRRRKA